MDFHDFSLTKKERLRSKLDFSRLKTEGTKVSSANFVVVRAASPCDHTRFGVTVSKKVGNAVIRNSVKRKLREFFRHHKQLFSIADYCVIARPLSAHLDSGPMHRELERLLSRFKK